MQRVGAIGFDTTMWYAARSGHIEIVKMCREWGATNFDSAMVSAAESRHIHVIRLCKEWGAKNFVMLCIMQLPVDAMNCQIVQEVGATNFGVVHDVVLMGHIKIVRICKKWGTNNYDEAMR